MKIIILLAFLLISFQSYARNVEVEIISAEFGIEDQDFRKTLCLTVVQVTKSKALLGVVEDIYDCHIARKAKAAKSNKLKIDLSLLTPIPYVELELHLQRLDTQLEFYFSEGE